MSKSSTRPSAEEVEAARLTLMRAEQAEQEEREKASAPLREITGSKAFKELEEKVEALPAEFMTRMEFAPHILAIRAGLRGLRTAAPPSSED